jgi:predicted RNase H-like nuclease (RuvC/YqgF family)
LTITRVLLASFDSFIVQMENGVTDSKFLHYARHEKMRTICHERRSGRADERLGAQHPVEVCQ